MKIEDISKAVTLNGGRQRILDLIDALENDPEVEVTITKPYKNGTGSYTIAYMDDDFKAVVIDYVRKELKEIEEEIHKL